MKIIKFEAKTLKIGGSLAVILPSYIVKYHDIQKGEMLQISIRR